MVGQFAICTHMLSANLVRLQLVRASATSLPFFIICLGVNPKQQLDSVILNRSSSVNSYPQEVEPASIRSRTAV